MANKNAPKREVRKPAKKKTKVALADVNQSAYRIGNKEDTKS
jgi:hypothetical protein